MDYKYIIKKILPQRVKKIYKKYNFYLKYGFFPPPEGTDLSGYEILLDTILDTKVYEIEGDIVEIGAFLGGGTYKLSKLIERVAPAKKIFVIDIFDTDFDKTVCSRGISMKELYRNILRGKNPYEIYKDITKSCKNVVTIISDSKQVKLPCEKICFAYIDGNHSPEYVRSDFYLVWNKIVSRGIVSFDDYGFDLPQVTETIHKLIGEQSDKILKIWTAGLKTIFIQKK